jgi:predicted DNA-binding WGR domain protein
MISESDLGRYEYHSNEENSHKFWWLIYDKTTRTYIAAWGRVGAKPQTKEYVGDSVAFKKVQEKLKKGYRRINNSKYATTQGSNAENFILSICEEEVA